MAKNILESNKDMKTRMLRTILLKRKRKHFYMRILPSFKKCILHCRWNECEVAARIMSII